ncbi:hypothetical protein [Lewinella sp. W8]|uniref:hypothetical protein n=1 Tax=Lewinella sp. W8 TaxID=2528208 RepID=UPI001067C305|nr:hypothetical protein [Lewinella sp. W8]MTB53993.1 hypothetical protein [Lewinella sp. W8]
MYNVGEIAKAVMLSSLKSAYTMVGNFFGGGVVILVFLLQFNVSLEKSLLYGLLGFILFFLITFIVKFSIKANQILEIQNAKIEDLGKSQLLPNGVDIDDIYPFRYLHYEVNRNLFVINEDAEHLASSGELICKVVGGKYSVSHIPHTMSTGKLNLKRYEGIKVWADESSFKRTTGGRITFENFKSSGEGVHTQVNFMPALAEGEIAEYKIRWEYPKSKVFSIEQFNYLRLTGVFPNSKVTESFSRQVSVPCDKFICAVKFPSNYRLTSAPEMIVKKRAQDIRIESTRANSKLSTFYNSQNNSDQIILDLENPILNLSYGIHWIPPTLDSLKDAGFIDEEKIDLIRKSIGHSQ